MKKYLLLIAAFGLFFFNSCSNDDDGGEATSIEATWNLTAMNPAIPGWDTTCPDDHTITFQGNGTADWTLYNEDNDCEPETSSGTWEQVSGNIYSVNIPGYGNVEGTVEFSGANMFTFSTSVQGFPVVLTFEK